MPSATRPQRPARWFAAAGSPPRSAASRPAAEAVALDPRRAGVDDVADAGHRERGLGDVGGEHYPARAVRRRPRPAAPAEAGKERQHLDPGGWCSSASRQRRGSPARREGRRARRRSRRQLPPAEPSVPRQARRRRRNRIAEVVVAASRTPPADLYRVEPTRDLQHRRQRSWPRSDWRSARRRSSPR